MKLKRFFIFIVVLFSVLSLIPFSVNAKTEEDCEEDALSSLSNLELVTSSFSKDYLTSQASVCSSINSNTRSGHKKCIENPLCSSLPKMRAGTRLGGKVCKAKIMPTQYPNVVQRDIDEIRRLIKQSHPQDPCRSKNINSCMGSFKPFGDHPGCRWLRSVNLHYVGQKEQCVARGPWTPKVVKPVKPVRPNKPVKPSRPVKPVKNNDDNDFDLDIDRDDVYIPDTDLDQDDDVVIPVNRQRDIKQNGGSKGKKVRVIKVRRVRKTNKTDNRQILVSKPSKRQSGGKIILQGGLKTDTDIKQGGTIIRQNGGVKVNGGASIGGNIALVPIYAGGGMNFGGGLGFGGFPGMGFGGGFNAGFGLGGGLGFGGGYPMPMYPSAPMHPYPIMRPQPMPMPVRPVSNCGGSFGGGFGGGFCAIQQTMMNPMFQQQTCGWQCGPTQMGGSFGGRYGGSFGGKFGGARIQQQGQFGGQRYPSQYGGGMYNGSQPQPSMPYAPNSRSGRRF